MSAIATSYTRVSHQTRSAAAQQIRRQLEAHLAYFAAHPDQIEQRLSELDQEWDVERCLETGSASLSLLGITLGLTKSKAWLLLPLAVQGFFLQHGIQGWCPPLPVFRALGFRTQMEIEAERYALKALRGDLDVAAAEASKQRAASVGTPSPTPAV
jgi:hypothetical protein